MKMMLSSHAEALADSSRTKGFVCSLDKQESSRRLATSLSLTLHLSLSVFLPLKHKYIYIHTYICCGSCEHREEFHIDASRLTHKKEAETSVNVELARRSEINARF